MTDEELVSRCIKKDLAAQKQLYMRFAGKMMGVCLRYAGSREEAQDLLQDGFVKVFDKIGTFRGECGLGGWITSVMINNALDNFRKTKPLRTQVEINENIHCYEDRGDLPGRLSEKELLEAIQRLPAGFRTVFNLYAIEGYNHNEIAEMLKIQPGTSKSQYARARMSLQKMLTEEKVTP
jgi:RNA polymerase sigma-70 factor (ECF subfamily)